jgi:hypothetical protein
MACFVFNLLFGLLYLGKTALIIDLDCWPLRLIAITSTRAVGCIQCVYRKYDYSIECFVCSPNYYTFDTGTKSLESRSG